MGYRGGLEGNLIPAIGYVRDVFDTANLGRKTGTHAQSFTGTGATAVYTGGQADIYSPNARYNFFENGGFDFMQRWPIALTANNALLGLSGVYAQTATGRQPCFDGWGITAQTVTDAQWGRIDSYTTAISGSVSRYYAQFKEVTAVGKIIVSKAITQKNTANLRGKYVRVQCKIATGAWGNAGGFRFGLLNFTGTADTLPATFATQSASTGVDPTWGTSLTAIAPILPDGGNLAGAGGATLMQIPNPGASANFTRYGAVFLVPTTAVNLVFVLYTDAQMSANDVFNVAEAGLYLGQEIMDWNPMSPGQELRRCEQDVCKSFNIDTAPVTNATIGTGEWSFPCTLAGANANLSGRISFPTRMRIAPTVTWANPAASNNFVRDVTHSADCTVTTTVNATEQGCSLTCTPTSAATAGCDLRVHFLADTATTTWC